MRGRKLALGKIDDKYRIPFKPLGGMYRGKDQALHAAGKARRINRRTGGIQGDVVEKGLQGGETVVVEGLQKVRSGMKVDPQPVTAPAQQAPAQQAPAQ